MRSVNETYSCSIWHLVYSRVTYVRIRRTSSIASVGYRSLQLRHSRQPAERRPGNRLGHLGNLRQEQSSDSSERCDLCVRTCSILCRPCVHRPGSHVKCDRQFHSGSRSCQLRLDQRLGHRQHWDDRWGSRVKCDLVRHNRSRLGRPWWDSLRPCVQGRRLYQVRL